jgi:hypothetical protein
MKLLGGRGTSGSAKIVVDMTVRYHRSKSPAAIDRGLAAAVTAGAIVLLAHAVMAQQPRAPEAPAQQNPPPHEPGMLEGIGRWFEDSAARFNSTLRGARGALDEFGDSAGGTAKGAADAAKDAADTVARLPGARIIEGRERCVTAANGAPDCRVAAETVCRGKGFVSGKSTEVQSAQKCPTRIWLSGRRPDPSECETEAFVVKAVCQ